MTLVADSPSQARRRLISAERSSFGLVRCISSPAFSLACVMPAKWSTLANDVACFMARYFGLRDFIGISQLNRHWQHVTSLRSAQLTLSTICWNLSPQCNKRLPALLNKMMPFRPHKMMLSPSLQMTPECWNIVERMTSLKNLEIDISAPPRFFESAAAIGLTALCMRHVRGVSFANMTNLHDLLLKSRLCSIDSHHLPTSLVSLTFSQSYKPQASLSIGHIPGLRSLDAQCAHVDFGSTTTLTRLCNALNNSHERILLHNAASLRQLRELSVRHRYQAIDAWTHTLTQVSPDLQRLQFQFTDGDGGSCLLSFISVLTQLTRLSNLDLFDIQCFDAQPLIQVKTSLRALRLSLLPGSNIESAFNALSTLHHLTMLNLAFGSCGAMARSIIAFTCPTHAGVWSSSVIHPYFRIKSDGGQQSMIFFQQLFKVHAVNSTRRPTLRCNDFLERNYVLRWSSEFSKYYPQWQQSDIRGITNVLDDNKSPTTQLGNVSPHLPVVLKPTKRHFSPIWW